MKTKNAMKAPKVDLAQNLDFLIRDTRLLLTAQIQKRIAPDGIPLRIWFPLRVLHESEGITQRELGRTLGYGDAHAGAIVRTMERHRLVQRRQSKVDRRRMDLYLTPRGRAMARRTLDHMRAINARIVSGFTDTEARRLHALLWRAHENLRTS